MVHSSRCLGEGREVIILADEWLRLGFSFLALAAASLGIACLLASGRSLARGGRLVAGRRSFVLGGGAGIRAGLVVAVVVRLVVAARRTLVLRGRLALLLLLAGSLLLGSILDLLGDPADSLKQGIPEAFAGLAVVLDFLFGLVVEVALDVQEGDAVHG